MGYRLLADAVALLHLSVVLFIGLGGMLALRWPRLVWVHLVAAVWGLAILFTRAICPLTPLEKALRVASGGEGYEGGFIGNYLVSPMFPDGLPRWLGIATFTAWALVNAWVYWTLARRPRSIG